MRPAHAADSCMRAKPQTYSSRIGLYYSQSCTVEEPVYSKALLNNTEPNRTSGTASKQAKTHKTQHGELRAAGPWGSRASARALFGAKREAHTSTIFTHTHTHAYSYTRTHAHTSGGHTNTHPRRARHCTSRESHSFSPLCQPREGTILAHRDGGRG